jgi:uncharacterized protein
MNLFDYFIIIVGLCLFEIISSIDNAIINGEVLLTMSKRARRWFLVWGILIAVFLVRGLLPLAIVWISTPSLTFVQALSSMIHSDPAVLAAIEESAPVLLMGGGTFLLFLFFHWLFLEPKHFGLIGEGFIQKQGVWFYAVASLLLTMLVWFSIKIDPWLSMGAVIGSSAFFITHGFKENAAKMEERMLKGETSMSDWSKILYLEVIDMTFSIDGVVGAFAFTLIIPLILIGNGMGAIVVRQLTIKNMDNVKKYIFLKNGAMYSIFVLGLIMVLDSLGAHIPTWLSPVSTVAIIAFFFWKSRLHLKKQASA